MFEKGKWHKAVKKAKTTRKKLRDQLDKLLGIIVRQRAGYKCEQCGKHAPLNTAHIISRINLATRWDRDNVFCFCVGCHFWGHQNPILFTEFVKEKLGDEKYEGLKKKSIEVKKWTIVELEALVEEFKKEITSEGNHS